MVNFLKATSRRKIILDKLRNIFLKRCYANLLIFIIVIALTITATLYLARPKVTISFPTGAAITNIEKENIKVTLEDRCINEGIEKTLIDITCPKQEPCKQNNCPEVDCSKCPENVVTESVFLIRCPNGIIVNSSEDCIEEFPEITSPYFTTINGVTVSLDNVEIEKTDEETKITRIEYSVINQGENAIQPEIWVKVYKTFTNEIRDARGIKTFNNKILEKNDWIQVKQDTNILVTDYKDKKIRLELLDSLPDPDEKLGAVFTDLTNFE